MTDDSIPERQILSVTQLNRSAKNLLEAQLPLLWIEGELSNWARPSSGHWYFTLKDQSAQVRCAMFKGRNLGVRFAPQNGDKVLVRGKVSLYEGRGDYQLIAEHMEPFGAGDLQRQFEALKSKLEHEGLFDHQRKQKLPQWPRHLGVVTSPSGAAIQDILQVLQRRYPLLPVLIFPVAVQGSEAPQQICKAIQLANQQGQCDVLIVGRGGGSLEDLWAFNDEKVARAIAASKTPIVSAVGHEVDFTIADFVADLRAPTPSAAAELVSPDGFELELRLNRFRSSLLQAVQRNVRQQRQKLDHLQKRLRHPGDRLRQQAQTLDRLELRLMRSIQQRLQRAQVQRDSLVNRLARQSPTKIVAQNHQRVGQLEERLRLAQAALFDRKHAQFRQAVSLLHNLSPLNTLKRGYAIVTTGEQEQVVRTSAEVTLGQRVLARLEQGTLTCEVKGKSPP